VHRQWQQQHEKERPGQVGPGEGAWGGEALERRTVGRLIYDGEWSEGKMSGKGRYVFPSGGVYEGDWRERARTSTGFGRGGT